jgi:hypothetical protein
MAMSSASIWRRVSLWIRLLRVCMIHSACSGTASRPARASPPTCCCATSCSRRGRWVNQEGRAAPGRTGRRSERCPSVIYCQIRYTRNRCDGVTVGSTLYVEPCVGQALNVVICRARAAQGLLSNGGAVTTPPKFCPYALSPTRQTTTQTIS